MFNIRKRVRPGTSASESETDWFLIYSARERRIFNVRKRDRLVLDIQLQRDGHLMSDLSESETDLAFDVQCQGERRIFNVRKRDRLALDRITSE